MNEGLPLARDSLPRLPPNVFVILATRSLFGILIVICHYYLSVTQFPEIFLLNRVLSVRNDLFINYLKSEIL